MREDKVERAARVLTGLVAGALEVAAGLVVLVALALLVVREAVLEALLPPGTD